MTIFVPKLLPPAAWCGTHVTSEQNLAIEPGQDKEEEHLLLGAATSTRIITTMTSSIQQTQASPPSHTFNFHYGLVVLVCVCGPYRHLEHCTARVPAGCLCQAGVPSQDTWLCLLPLP